MPYNGHKNWNHWNVSLWINNDESIYRMARNFHDLKLAGIFPAFFIFGMGGARADITMPRGSKN